MPIFIPILIGVVVLGITAIIQLTGGVQVSTGDPESFFGGEDGDPFDIPLPKEAKAALGGLLILGALILGATLLKGRK